MCSFHLMSDIVSDDHFIKTSHTEGVWLTQKRRKCIFFISSETLIFSILFYSFFLTHIMTVKAYQWPLIYTLMGIVKSFFIRH